MVASVATPRPEHPVMPIAELATSILAYEPDAAQRFATAIDAALA